LGGLDARQERCVVGGFKCPCGQVFSGSRETSGEYILVPREHAEIILFPTAEQFEGKSRQGVIECFIDWEIFDCPNCGRMLRGVGNGIIPYVRDQRPPRVWADFSDRDSLGRVLLRSKRSLDEIQRQRLLLAPPLELILYDDDVDLPGVAEFGIGDDGQFDKSLWAVSMSLSQ